jgi:hypothetical protein
MNNRAGCFNSFFSNNSNKKNSSIIKKCNNDTKESNIIYIDKVEFSGNKCTIFANGQLYGPYNNTNLGEVINNYLNTQNLILHGNINSVYIKVVEVIRSTIQIIGSESCKFDINKIIFF